MRSPNLMIVCCGLSMAIMTGCGSSEPPVVHPVDEPLPSLGKPQSAPPVETPQAATIPSEETSPMLSVQSAAYGTTPDGQEITQYVLKNSQGMTVKVINLGGIITSVEVPDRAGLVKNVVLSFPDLESYLKNAPYFGGICGRFANRIAKAKFTLDDKEYELFANNGENHLHGGKESFIKKVWKAESLPAKDGSTGVSLSYVSSDGEEGYPGELTVNVVYSLNEDNELTINYTATTDKPTVLNLTNHSYWNLAGNKYILDHQLTLFADEYVDIDEAGIPTGELLPVKETCMDFTEPHAIGERIAETTNGNGGYDHCYVVRGGGKGELVPVAKVEDRLTGRVMEVSSTEPGVQLYTGNYLEGTPETGNAVKHGAFCLETQHFPDSPNRPEFPSVVLRPGETYSQTTVHKFSAAQ